MTKKELNKIKILEFLSDPDNDFVNRSELAVTVLGYKHQRTLYRHFTTEELNTIENKALQERKSRSARQRANIYNALYKRSMGYSHPDVHISNYQGVITVTKITKHYPPETQAGREYLDRTEGKVPDKEVAPGSESSSNILKQLAEILPD